MTDGSAPTKAEAEIAALRAAQISLVMPLIGPLLDAWEAAPNDELEPGSNLNRALADIQKAMTGGPSVADLERALYAERKLSAAISRDCNAIALERNELLGKLAAEWNSALCAAVRVIESEMGPIETYNPEYRIYMRLVKLVCDLWRKSE